MKSWLTPLTPTGLPAAGIVPTAQDALALLEAAASPIVFRNLPLTHPVTEALLQAAANSKVLNRWQRAGLNLEGSFDNWLMQNFDQKRRKELKRLRSRLSEQGELQSLSLESDGDFRPFFQAFLSLEAESWKGETRLRNCQFPKIAHRARSRPDRHA